MLMKFTNF